MVLAFALPLRPNGDDDGMGESGKARISDKGVWGLNG